MKKFFAMILAALTVTALAACSGTPAAEKPQGREAVTLPNYVQETTQIEQFIAQGSDATGAQLDGIVRSPYYDVTVDGVQMPVYAVPVTYGGPHSFTMLDCSEDQFPMQVELSPSYTVTNAQVLPEKLGVSARVESGKVTFTVNGYGNFTVIFNGDYPKAYTLFVREYEVPEVPKGYQLIEYQAGIHFVDSISLESNTVLYLHSGALLVAKQPTVESETPTLSTDWAGMTRWKSFISAEYAENVTIAGHGMIDLTNLNWHARSPISIVNCQQVSISGICIINAPEWNITVTLSSNVTVRDVIIFGYRQNSDGIAMVDTQHALIEDCFIRSGDDLFEVKSMYSDSPSGGNDIVYRNCVAWADKCRAFGIIQETKNDMSNILFEDCAVLFRLATWSEELGSLIVLVGDGGHISDVTFRNVEIFQDATYAVNVSLGPTDWSEGDAVGSIQNILFENVSIRNNRNIRLRGVGGAPDYITFRNVTVDGSKITALDQFNVTRIQSVGEHITVE